MRKSYWFGWSLVFFVFGIVTVVGTLFMSDIFVGHVDPFNPRGGAFMTVGGQMLLLGIASTVTGVATGLFGLVFGRFHD